MSIEQRSRSVKCGAAAMSATRVGHVAALATSDPKTSNGAICGVSRSDAGAGA